MRFCRPSFRGRILYDRRRDSPAEFISSWSTCWHWVRDVGVEFEVLALDEDRQPSSYPHVRRVDIGFEVGHVGVGVEAVGFKMSRLVSRRLR